MQTVQVGTKKQDVETTVAFDKSTFWLLDPNGKTLKAFPYSSIKAAEYSYSMIDMCDIVSRLQFTECT